MHNIIVYDLETTGKDPRTVFPIQFAAIPVDGASLKPKFDDVFNQMCKPPNFDDMINYKDDSEKEGLWKFHARNRGVSIEQMIELVGSSPSMNVVFPQFTQFIKQYRANNRDPILAGHNICNYDNVIINRLIGKNKTTWNPIYFLDTMNLCYGWLRTSNVTRFSLDSLRDYFGLTKGGHEALKDCSDCAIILSRFLKYQQELSAGKNYFANAFTGDSV